MACGVEQTGPWSHFLALPLAGQETSGESLRAPVSSLRNEDNELVFVECFESCGWSVRGISDLSELGRTAVVSLGCKAREKKACL